MFKINPLLATDGYKTSHHKMYPKNTTKVFSNFTPRSVKYMPEGAKEIVVFGTQYTFKYIKDLFDCNFFSRQKYEVLDEVKIYLDSYLSTDYDVSHFEKLYNLGYLPIEVRTLDEGSVIKEKIPILTIHNTVADFYWLPNFLETLISTTLWKPMHSASMSYAYNKIIKKFAQETDKENLSFTDFQCHDFSMRGMQSLDSAIGSGLGFLTCSKGTDTIPTLQAAKYYYGDADIAFSVPASEHAVMTSYGKEDEIGAFRRLMSQYPTGILSVVSDSFDLWQVCTTFMTELKEEILARDGKIVIRPDSGNPVDILCGIEYSTDIYDAYKRRLPLMGQDGYLYEVEETYYDEISERNKLETTTKLPYSKNEIKGVIELLWEVFGGTINNQSFKVLERHIGAIYGDSITLNRAEEICQRLKDKGFASTNVVFGIGSYSLGYATRDNQGSAVKATYCEVDGKGREIFKDPITDDGTKKSAKGLLAVVNGKLKDQCSWEDVNSPENQLTILFKDGEFKKTTTITKIRQKLNG